MKLFEAVLTCMNNASCTTTLEGLVRSLKQLGVPAEASFALLLSIVIARIPEEISLTATGELKDEGDWKVDRLLKCLRKLVRHQCENNSADANSAKETTVRMKQECERQQCECQQCDAKSVRKSVTTMRTSAVRIARFLLKITDTDIGLGRIWTEQKKKGTTEKDAQGDMLSHSNCERDNSANETRVRTPAVQLSAVRCEIGAKKE